MKSFFTFLQGGLAVAVPGEIKGYFSAKQRYGNPNITWASLLNPSIKMAEEGIPVSWTLASALESDKELVYSDPGLR
jgi:gamma-glutamyltranspeptidase/glutathione hydrolase/leukotriene-C4 hydrolase